MNQLATIEHESTAMAGTASAIFSPDGLDKLLRFAEVMANGRVAVPAHLAGKPSDCLAITMQAAQWGMNPFAVAQKTHVVSGTLGYEAQLVNAVINKMSPTKDRIHYEWFGPWENVIGKFVEKTSKNGNAYIAPGWSLKDEAGCGIRAWATMKGEDEPRALELLLSQAQVRNSTLWASDPKQQLAYLAVKRWARLYCPDVIMGVYTPDELEETRPRVERDITPTPQAGTASGMNSLINAKAEKPQEQTVRSKPERTPEELLSSFTEYASGTASVEELDAAYTAAAKRLANHEELLNAATDVYNIRKDELNEVPM